MTFRRLSVALNLRRVHVERKTNPGKLLGQEKL